jgi:4-amino-4-deoxychorismate lyase
VQIRISEPVPKGLTVIETMRAEPDGSIRLWTYHQARLRRDCEAVGFPLDEDAIAAALVPLPRGQALRVRLTVDDVGRVAISHGALPPTRGPWLVSISNRRLNSSDPWLRVKTSHRPAYEAARQAMPEDCQETLLLNERGEVCEGSITNIFLQRGHRLMTPHLKCGVLPGVLRASLLDQDGAEEVVLNLDDLRDGQLFCGNAVRGLIPARIVTV